jgi:DNA-binding transcriptional MocR family regulator
MTIWHPNLDGKSGPKYKLIAQAIGESIADGSLAERDRLPAQRDLAYQLGLSLNTVSRAYAEAIRRGFLHGEIGRGTFVRTSGPLPAEVSQARMTRPWDGPIDFRLNLPAAGEGAAVLAETLGSLSKSAGLSSYLDFQADGDQERHTEAAAAWIGQLGLEASSDDIVLTNGAQNGLMAAMLAVMRPGDVLLTESTTYAPIKAMARHLGLKLFPLAMDGEGLLPEALEAACGTTAAKTLFCLPTLHTPTTVTMTLERRRNIAEIARKHELVIIEDDVFGFLPPDRPPPLASFAPECTVFVTSVSKCLAPGLRIGYLHAPSRFHRSLRTAVNLSCWMPAPLMAEIASIWIEEGTAQRLNDYQRSEAQLRQRMAQRILGAHRPRADPFGFHLWLPLPAHWRADAFRVAAERQGVKVLAGETFAVEQTTAPQAIRLCLSHEATRERVTRGLKIIAALLNETSDPGVLVV